MTEPVQDTATIESVIKIISAVGAGAGALLIAQWLNLRYAKKAAEQEGSHIAPTAVMDYDVLSRTIVTALHVASEPDRHKLREIAMTVADAVQRLERISGVQQTAIVDLQRIEERLRQALVMRSKGEHDG